MSDHCEYCGIELGVIRNGDLCENCAFVLKEGYTAGAQAATEQCIKDVCQACYLGYEPIFDERTKHWHHRRESGDDTLCWASPIRRRVVEEGE